MKNKILITVLIGGLLAVLTSCEEKKPVIEEKINPFELEVGWNGFYLDGTSFDTPNAIIEIWGETDSLSADYDINFTDGTFNPIIRDVFDYSILVYFDINSPILDELSTGSYYFENTPEREPNKIVEAFIQISNDSTLTTVKYPVIEGLVEVSEANGYFLVEYLLKTVKDGEIVEVIGQYTGAFQLIDQTLGLLEK